MAAIVVPQALDRNRGDRAEHAARRGLAAPICDATQHPMDKTKIGVAGLVACGVLVATACVDVDDEPTAFAALEVSDDEADPMVDDILPSATPSAAAGYCDVVGDCDPNPCATMQCLEHHCIATPTAGGPCDDGNACTLDDWCVAGQCIGSESVELLSGTVAPAAEGWIQYGDTAASSNGSVVTVSTTTIPLTYRYSTYGLGLSAADMAFHDLQWSMTVDVADHNPFDASVAVLPEFTGWYGWGPNPRAQMIYFEEDRIGWGDEASSYLVDTTVPRTYRLRRTTSGGAELYVDNVLALTRPALTIGPMVGFGDQTNDWGVDGQFDISHMLLTPNPSCKAPPPPPK